MNAQYSQCEHGFVLTSGTVDTSLQPQCTKPECVRLAEVPPEAAAYHATTNVQQSMKPHCDEKPMLDWKTLLPQGLRRAMTSEEKDAKRSARYFEEQQAESELVLPALVSHTNSTWDGRFP